MAFKVLFVVRAPGSNPAKDRSFLKTPSIEVTTIAFELSDSEGVIKTCLKEVAESGIHVIVLCPAVSNDLVAELSKRLENKVAVFVGRGDFPSVHLASEVTTKEWFN
jgi:hypothetical protein